MSKKNKKSHQIKFLDDEKQTTWFVRFQDQLPSVLDGNDFLNYNNMSIIINFSCCMFRKEGLTDLLYKMTADGNYSYDESFSDAKCLQKKSAIENIIFSLRYLFRKSELSGSTIYIYKL